MARLVHGVSRWLALAGGAVLLAIVLLVCVSIIGRTLNGVGHAFGIGALQALGPVRGDFELVEAGVAFAVMAFLPWCHVNRGHAKVDIIAASLPGGLNAAMMWLWDALFAVVLAVIAWRLFVGMQAKAQYGETTFLLQFPVWWGYAACFAASSIAALVAAWVVLDRSK